MAHEDRMRALSLLQPWLYAITDLGKRVENRTWLPPIYMIGERFALHASARKVRKEWKACEQIYGSTITKEVPTSAVVATAVIVNWFDKDDKTPIVDKKWWSEQEKWFFGPNGWILAGLHILDDPIPCKGALSFWRLPNNIEREIKRQLVRDGILEVSL